VGLVVATPFRASSSGLLHAAPHALTVISNGAGRRPFFYVRPCALFASRTVLRDERVGLRRENSAPSRGVRAMKSLCRLLRDEKSLFSSVPRAAWGHFLYVSSRSRSRGFCGNGAEGSAFRFLVYPEPRRAGRSHLPRFCRGRASVRLFVLARHRFLSSLCRGTIFRAAAGISCPCGVFIS
jgi:hypothetical protein